MTEGCGIDRVKRAFADELMRVVVARNAHMHQIQVDEGRT
jgi:hypothetical protein